MQWFNPLPRTLQNPRTDTSSEQGLFLKLEASVGLWVLIAALRTVASLGSGLTLPCSGKLPF